MSEPRRGGTPASTDFSASAIGVPRARQLFSPEPALSEVEGM